MRLFRRKCAFLLDLLALTCLCLLSVLVVHQFWRRHPRGGEWGEREPTFLSPTAASAEDPHSELGFKLSRRSGQSLALPHSRTADATAHAPRPESCTMGRCFNVSKCRGTFLVYVYPDKEGLKVSGLYQKFLRVLRTSQYYTSDPDKACLLVPSWDTLDRDKLSDGYVHKLPSPTSLPHWNGGRNHLFFNLYSGSWPSYEENLDFETGLAMIAKASFNQESFRPTYDISLPLLHSSHPERGTFPTVLYTAGNLLPPKRRYLLAFKGKRYLYGLGIEPRRSLYHIHNGRDIAIATTCRHNKHWEWFQDERCGQDNTAYDMYDYTELLTNSTFCLVPRGRRLGSFRFLEALQASCVPVSLSNGYVLPFSEIIDWSQSSLAVDERHLLQIPHTVRSMTTHQILDMREHGSWVYETYLSSVEKVVMTTIEIIRNRLQRTTSFLWNRYPGGLNFDPHFSSSLSDYPFYYRGNHKRSGNYTIVVLCTKPALKGTSPLIKLLKSLAKAPRLAKIFILWEGSGSPHISLPPLPVPAIIPRDHQPHPLSQFQFIPEIETDAILFLSEDVELTVDEAEFGFETWQAFPDRLVGYAAHKHLWDKETLKWIYSSDPSNEYSIVLTGAVFCHRYYSHLLTYSLPKSVQQIATTEPNCADLVLNFLVSHITQKPPIKATHKQGLTHTMTDISEASHSFVQNRIPCLNLLVTGFGYMPLRYSSVRMDPVLFKDSVSMLRKEYRILDRL